MDKSGGKSHGPSTTYMIALLLALLCVEFALGAVKIEDKGAHVTIDNGLVQLTFLKPQGMLTEVRYQGINNLLEPRFDEDERGYYDLNWNKPGNLDIIDRTEAEEFKIILQNEKQVEISFIRTWNKSSIQVPLNIDKRYIVLDGSHGFYTYAIYERLEGWPDFNLNQTRVVYKLDKELFRYMAVDEKRQRLMPFYEDRDPKRSEALEYKEAVRLVNPIDPIMVGEVDDKYMYSSENENIKVHGWVSNNISRGPSVGFWHLTPSYEFRSGGPFKQELTSHVGPITLTDFLSSHYFGANNTPMFRNGEPWKKVYGPVFLYLNSGPPGTDVATLWKDANNQLKIQAQMWPYEFPASDDFPKSVQRGSVRGRLLIRDRYINKDDIPAASAYVGLAAPGNVGSWQIANKGYQFWTKTDPDGSFVINNIRVGVYDLHATVIGFISDYKSNVTITVTPGSNIDLGDSVYMPPRTGPTLWEIGIPDRSAAEFFIPNPDTNLMNPLFKTFDQFRQYGLWEQYTSLYKEDLIYTINTSNYHKDWFYAQVTRRIGASDFEATTWQIRFKLDNVVLNGIYVLRVALASATNAELEIRFNDQKVAPPHFTTGFIGKDNALARHGIHGLYWLFNIEVKSAWLVPGMNNIFLTQARKVTALDSIMYDYIRFEGPSTAR